MRVLFAEDIVDIITGQLSLVLTMALLAPGMNMDSLRGVLASKRAIVEAVGGSWRGVIARICTDNDLIAILVDDLQRVSIPIELENIRA